MSDVPITQNTKSLSKFLAHIKSAGVPANVNTAYLKAAGFTSSNDFALLKVFKFLKFVDATGTPTARWQDYRDDSKSKLVLGQAIKECYGGLFEMYEDAYRKDDEAIGNWLRSNTSFAGVTIERAVRTFKALCAEADFTGGVKVTPLAANAAVQATDPTPFVAASVAKSGMPSVNINVELQLPASTDPKVYELFFSAMKKYLLEDQK